MHELFHIFRKDLFRFRIQIGVLLLLTGIVAYSDIRSSPGGATVFVFLLRFVLFLAWWAIIAAAVHEEALAGDRQFWVTRPCHWGNLLAAKLFFITLIVNGSLVIAGCFILGLQGFPVISKLPSLLLGQLLVILFFLLPALLLATVTRTVGQFAFLCALVLIAFLVEGAIATIAFRQSAPMVSLAAPDSFWLFLLLPVLTIPLIVRQYARRRTEEDRVLVAASVLIFLPLLFVLPHEPWRTIREAVKPQIDVSRVALSLDPERPRAGDGASSQQNWVPVKLPVRVTGLPAIADLQGFSPNLQIKLSDGSTLARNFYANLTLDNDGYSVAATLEKSDFARMAGQSVSLHAVLTLTALSNQATLRVPLGSAEFHIPDVGICRIEMKTLSCRQALWEPHWTNIWLEGAGERSGVMIIGAEDGWPVSLVWGSSPVTKWTVPLDAGIHFPGRVFHDSAARVVFLPRRRLARFSRNLDIPGIRLADYQFEETR